MTDATQRTAEQTERMIVECTDCVFHQTGPFEETTPADVVIEHGRSTGHTLQITEE